MIMPKPRVFLSYAREDETHARRIYNALSRRDIQVWMDKMSLLGGEDFDAAIRKAIQESDFFLVLLSKTATAKRGYINKEIRRALDILDELPEGMRFVIP